MRIHGGQVLAEGALHAAAVTVEDGVIAALDGAASGQAFDAAGLMVLPGIVDLHGDAFERQLQPRPGIGFPVDLALRDTGAQLAASGITTAFHGITLSWEPGLRGIENWRALLDGIARLPAHGCEQKVHLRWELHNLEALDEALADVEAGRVAMLAFNDHTPSILKKLDSPATAAKFADRAGMGLDAFRALAEAAWARLPEVDAAAARLAAAARARGLPMASHDDYTLADRARFRALGAAICEFPTSEAVAEDAGGAGEAVVMGSPNVVRGGSHLNWASAQAMAERGICTALVSDYYYPAMVPAALRLGQGPLGLPASWDLVSARPAAAAKLHDRGRIAPGMRADLVVLEPASGAVVLTLAAGRIAYLTPEGHARLS